MGGSKQGATRTTFLNIYFKDVGPLCYVGIKRSGILNIGWNKMYKTLETITFKAKSFVDPSFSPRNNNNKKEEEYIKNKHLQ